MRQNDGRAWLSLEPGMIVGDNGVDTAVAFGHILSSMNETMTSEKPRLGDWLREARNRKGAPLRVVAAAADMDTALLSKIELGQRLPTPAQTVKLARFFGVDANDMHARRIAEKFRQEFWGHPAAADAIMMLAEESGVYRTRTGR